MYKLYTKCASVHRRIVKFLFLLKVLNGGSRRYKNNVWMMCITMAIISIIIPSVEVQASDYPQNINLAKQNVSLEEVFKALKHQTDYDFVYSKKQLEKTNRVSIVVKNATINEVLDLCFANQPLFYVIEEKSIIIKLRAGIQKTKAVNNHYIELNGIVYDEQKIPIIGASVKIKNSKIITLTDGNGAFKLTSPKEKGVLLATYIGFEPQELSFDRLSHHCEFKLKIALNDLNEIQIIGYGKTTRKLNTGSIASISAKQIEQQPVTNVLSALSGRMPGVFVQTTNGLPGGNINVQIRGKGSMVAGTIPLYIIDGVPYDGGAVNRILLGENSVAGALNPINNINPSDIESVTVLKDADATSIYGSRGTNGVILITTKKSSSDQTRLDLNFQNGLSTVAEKPQYLNLDRYLALRREAFANDSKIPSADPLNANYAPDLTIYNQTAATDWSDYLLGNTAGSQDLQMKVSGGKETTTFSISGNYRNEETVLPGKNRYQRGGLSFEIQHRPLNSKFNISLSTQFTRQNTNLSNIFQGINNINLAPNFPLTLDNGTLNWDSGANILASMQAKSKTRIDNLISNLTVGYQITKNLNFKISTGYNRATYDQSLIFPSQSLSPGITNYSIFGKNLAESIITEPQLNYSLKINKHSVTLLAGGTYQQRLNDTQLIQASNYKLESLMEDLGSAGAIDSRSTTYAQYKYASIFGRLTYNFNETYILNGTLRRDGSSRFGPNNRFGNFGSIGAAWIVSNLKFVKELLPAISLAKLRASYGATGNDQISDYQFLSTYSSPSTNNYQDVQTIRPTRISNSDFHWETTKKLDLGLEFGFLDSRYSISADYYLNTSSDQLVNYAIPSITGFASYQANLPAVVENKGWEFSMNALIINKKNFSWSSSFNLTLPKNKLKSFQDFASSSYSRIYELGSDITRIYGVQFLGIDATTGMATYADQNGVVSAAPYAFSTLGKASPDLYGGLSNTLRFGNIEFDVFAQLVKQVSFGSLNGNIGSLVRNNFAIVEDRWSASNMQGNLPKASTRYDSNLGNSSLNIFDTSYVRLKNISINYRIPKKIIERFKLSDLRLQASAQNLFTFWDDQAAVKDPEIGSSGNIPPLKTVSFGFKLSL